MTRFARFKFVFVLMLAVLGDAVWSGCDLTGQYNTQFQAALEKSARQAVFDLNLHAEPTELTDFSRKPLGVKLRLPKFFDKDSKQLAANDPRLQTMMAVAGVQYALERSLDDTQGQFSPVHLLVSSVPKKDQKIDALQAALAVPGTTFSDVSLDTPQGSTLSMKRLQVQQKVNAPKKKGQTVDVKMDIYLADAGTRSVVFAWVAPKPQAEKYSFEAASVAAMGTVEFESIGDDDDEAPRGKRKKSSDDE